MSTAEINVSTAGMKLPTDDEIIAAWRNAPTPETVKCLCIRCKSDSRPIRVLSEAGIIGFKAVRAAELPKVNDDKQAGIHKMTQQDMEDIFKLRDEGKTVTQIAAIYSRHIW